MTQHAWFDSPIGLLKITGSVSEGVTEIKYYRELPPHAVRGNVPPCLDECFAQLEEYFMKKRTFFTVKTTFRGTDFQRDVWRELLEIPYGQTTSYLKIAMKIGDRKAVRAVGGACNQNPIPIIAPCHRVIGISGDLTGYNSGIEIKKDLLMLENPMSFGKQVSLF